MIGKKINQLATELAPASTDLTIIGDPISGVSKKITIAQLGAIFSGAVSFYDNFAAFPATGDINVIYCAKDTKKLYLWSGSAYTEVFPSQALLDTYQLRSEKGNANGYASLDSGGKVPISQLPSSIMEYKGTWNAATNTPTLANGTGDTGDVYICNVAGTVNFGAGPLTFAVGDYVIYSGSIWQRSSGAVGTVTSVAASITGDSVTISGSPVTTSGTLAFAFNGTTAQYIRGNGTLETFPSLTGFVPYTGATANVDLGTHTLLAAKGIFSSSGSGDTVGITHSSGSGIALNITKGGNGEGLYINKTSGSGNAATIIGTLNATTLVKSGGTSSQFLKADGSVDSTAYGTGSVTSVAALTIGTTGTDLSSTVANSTTTPVITLNVPTASATNRGALSSADWTTFNNKQNALTNPVTGTGTTNYIAKFTGTSTIGNSLVFDNGTNVGIGTNSPTFLLDVNGTLRASANVTGTDNVAVFHNTNTTTAGTPVIALSTASTGIDAPADIRLAGTNTKGIRIYAADSTLTSTPLGAGFQMFSVSSTTYPGQMFFDSGANNNAFIAFRTAVTSGTISERMRITASGNVGIGTTSPTDKFVVSNGGANTLHFDVEFSGGASTIYSYNRSTSAYTNLQLSASNIIFQSGGTTERMRITSGGNVLVNSTTDNGQKMQIVGGASTALRLDANSGVAALNIGAGATLLVDAAGVGGGRFSITSGGNVLIGTTTNYSDYRFQVAGASSANSYSAYFLGGGSTSNAINIYLPGNRSSDTTYNAIALGDDLAYRFRVYGNGNVQNTNNSYGSLSDIKLKENITDTTPKLDDLLKVKIRNYNLIGEQTKQLGVIAQELEEIFPSMIEHHKDLDKDGKDLGTNTKSVKYSVFVPMLIKAVQELKQELDTLKNK
jgi:hypothetical protein